MWDFSKGSFDQHLEQNVFFNSHIRFETAILEQMMSKRKKYKCLQQIRKQVGKMKRIFGNFGSVELWVRGVHLFRHGPLFIARSILTPNSGKMSKHRKTRFKNKRTIDKLRENIEKLGKFGKFKK